jgi:tyrosyl-tRNA synthetase
MQGYDSVAMDVDMEVGGTDQTFNMLVGRTLQSEINKHEKVVMSFELLEGLDGRKMSKSYKNIVGVMDAPADMYGKIMSLADNLIVRYFWLCTNATKADIEGMEHALKKGQNPRDLKMCLARELVTLYHSEKAATEAEKAFVDQFQKKNAPTEATEYRLSKNDATLADVLVSAKMVASKGEARRLAQQGGVRVNGDKVTDMNVAASTVVGAMLQVGKRKFIQVVK